MSVSNHKKKLDTSRDLNIQMHYQWVPAHVGIEGNEEANSLANDMRSQSTLSMQMQHEIKPASLKTFLHQHEKQKFFIAGYN